MRKYFLLVVLIAVCGSAMAQNSTSGTSTANDPTTSTVNGLNVPISPAFSITDITPTLVQNPTTPKAFALGVVQSASQNSSNFPNNYSAQFAPVWWIDPAGISIYSYLGVPRPGKGTTVSQNIFSGLRFTSLSVAFVNKDLIPDTSKALQSVFSLGIHSTVIRVYSAAYVAKLSALIKQWHDDAQFDLTANAKLIDAISRLDPDDPKYKHKVDSLTAFYQATKSGPDFKAINGLIVEKPVFAWDVAAAVAMYGVNNQAIETGRAGVWTGLSINMPLDKTSTNYFTVNALGRYLYDRNQVNDSGAIGRANNFDAGGNLGFELNRLNIAVESLYRFTNGAANTQNRTVGNISVRLTDNIYINGSFGKDFAGPNKLISLFGINWGFGKEKVTLPDLSAAD